MKCLKVIAVTLLTATLLSLLSACNQPSSDTDPSTESDVSSEASSEQQVQAPERETYKDLSFDIPAHTDPKTKTVTIKSEGKSAMGGIHLDFTQMSGEYVISPTKVGFNCHDVASCDDCGYVSTEHGGAYLMSSQGLDQGGITVTVATPILASSVDGMTLTFMTTADATASSMRILTGSQTNNAAFINTCEPMGGATEEWVTVDLGVEDFSELADSDGYIRSFQMYFRNKSGADCYVQSIDIATSPKELLLVDRTDGQCLFRDGALRSVAQIIAKRLTAADIAAEITVTGVAYRKNTTTLEGFVRYTASAKLDNGQEITIGKHTATVPPVTGVWLDATDGEYGSSHDAKGQWQDTFDPAGLLFLTDNTLTCDEGIKAIEYAVVGGNTAFDDAQTVWLTPQMIETNEQGFSYLLVNAFLDYGNSLAEGESYRLLVRGVTKRNNYILHLDIPFTYQYLSASITHSLRAAQSVLEQADILCSGDVQDKADYVQKQISALINDPSIDANVEIVGEGLESMRINVSIKCSAVVAEPRFPVYELDGKVITDVYNFVGKAFVKEDITVKYSDKQSSITLMTPYDGDCHVILAADVIYQHAYAPLDEVQHTDYGYVAKELCTPVPVTLTWTDENAAEGKSYTVLLSKNRDLSDALEITVNQTSAQIEHLNVGTTYYWQVRSGDESSFVQVFTTEDGYPRFVRLDGVSNVRDIGGYVTVDGKRVKQNLAYRSAQLESITDQAREFALNELHIRTDLDLRGGHTNPLGGTVQHISVSMQWYEHIFEKEHYEAVRQTVSAFAKEENYPIVFHCTLGRDRTGTASFLILGLLGVDEDTLRHEYYASYFSEQGSFDPNEFPMLIVNVNRLVDGLNDFGDEDDTLQQKIHAYLLHIGVTEEEIQSIRDIWLED